MSGDAVLKLIQNHKPSDPGKGTHPDEWRIYRGVMRAAVDLMAWVGDGPVPATRPRARVLEMLTTATGGDQALMKSLKASLVQADVPVLVITNIYSVLRLIRRMGNDPQAHLPARLLSIADETHVIFVSPTDHYAYPLVINGRAVDLRTYRHSYPDLMGAGSADSTTQVLALTEGSASPDQICVAIANWICESDRNWAQLPLTLAANAKGVSTTTLYADHEMGWPMGPGSWKQATWAGGENPQSTTAGPVPAETLRLMCRMAIKYLFKEDWWIKHLDGGPAGGLFSPQFLENSIAATLLIAAKAQANKLFNATL